MSNIFYRDRYGICHLPGAPPPDNLFTIPVTVALTRTLRPVD